jgi:hexokinase
MSTAFYDKKTVVGLILGTGTNACYFEKFERIQTLNSTTRSKLFDKQEMVVNTEWGAFGENGNIDFIRSRFDDEIDKTSINVGKQIFEKMVSGMYLGEIVRLVILDLIDNGLLFADAMKKNTYRNALFTKGSFYTKYLHEIESDSTLSTTKRILKEIAGIDKPFDDDCCVVRSICHIVTKRAAKLTAAGKLSFINKFHLLNIILNSCHFETHFKV